MGHVTIVGAGIVGVSSALWLQRKGFAITLIDAQGVGEGTSFGNAGNISPGAVVPYTIPGVLKEAPGWLLNPEGPLAVRPGYFPTVAPWLCSLARFSTTEAALQTSLAMRALHGRTFDYYAQLTRGTEAEKLIVGGGQLYVSEKPNGATGSLLSRFMREAAGVRSIAMNQDEIRDFEPTLSPTFRSGMLLPDNGRTTNPGRLVKVLGEEAFRLGAEFVQGQVTEVQFEGERVRAIRVGGEFRPVDILLVAAGAASGEISRQLRTKIPIEAERGYHITIPDANVKPHLPITNVDAKFAVSPMDVGLRLAGTVEYAGIKAPPNWKRAALLEAQAKRMFPGLELQQVQRWSGDRPTLPDGLPVLGAAPKASNAYFAFGNSHFGMTAGPAMGRLISQVICGDTPDVDLKPFDPRRFTSRQ